MADKRWDKDFDPYKRNSASVHTWLEVVEYPRSECTTINDAQK